MNITIVSAHKGSDAWVSMTNEIVRSTGFNVFHFYEYDDDYYRRPHGVFSRLILRFRTFIVFPLRFILSFRRLDRSTNTFICITSPFYLPLLFNIFHLSCNKKKILLMNDIYPEALIVRKLIKRGSWFENYLKNKFVKALNYFDSVVFISDSHKLYYNSSKNQSLSVIPVPGNTKPFKNVGIDNTSGALKFIYSGTLGLMHDTHTFLSWLQSQNSFQNYIFNFYTSGALKAEFEKRVKVILIKRSLNGVHLHNSLSHESWVSEMISAQIGLVFQSRGSGAVVFPSKVASNLAAGHAILAVADKDSELANMVLQHNCGWVVEPGDISSFNEAVIQSLTDDILIEKRNNSLILARSMFSESVIAGKWAYLLSAL
jgi:colanic acid biosynthesis glycosyl transferase WcaI